MNVSLYWRNLTGCCLLAFPFALLLFFPYEKERFHFSPLFPPVLFVILGVVSALCPLFAGGQYFTFCLNAVLSALVLAFYALVRDSFTHKSVTLFVASFFLKAQAVLVYGYDAVQTIMGGGTLGNTFAFHANTLWVLFLAAAVFVPLIALFEHSVLTAYLRAVPCRVMWLEILLLAVCNLVFYLLAFFSAGTFAALADKTGAVPPWGVVPLLLLFTLALAGVHCITFRTTLARALELETRMQMELLRENSIHLQREMRRSREMYHDLRQLLRQLHEMSGRNGFSELRPYIERIVSLTEHADTVFCENNCLNALFQYYAGCANERNISIKISAVCGEVSVRDADLTLLLANALENAITGAQEYREQTGREPDISVTAGIIQHRLLIQITNHCAAVRYRPGVAEKEKHSLLPADAFVSTHENGGYGLKRIDWIAAQYQGSVRFQFDEAASLWTTRIAIPVRNRARTPRDERGRTA